MVFISTLRTMADDKPVLLDIATDPLLMHVSAPATIPKQSTLFRACTAVAGNLVNKMVDMYGRDWLFANSPDGTVEHSELLVLLRARADTVMRVQLAGDISRVMTPLIRYQELFRPTNTRSLQENQAVINDIQNQLTDALRYFNIVVNIA